MDDAISRQAAIDAVQNRHMMLSKEKVLLINDLEKLPSAEPKRGKWKMEIDERFVQCSECGLMTTRNELRGIAVFGKNEPNFCPNCGADMRQKGENSESN